MGGQIVRFWGFELDFERAELRERDTAAAIQRKPLELLTYLVLHRERVVSKQELLQTLWPDAVVSEHALTSALRDLRRALGDGAFPHRTIVTLRAKGYRFVAPVADEGDGGDGKSPAFAARAKAVLADEPFVERDEIMAQLGASLRAAIAGALRISLLAARPASARAVQRASSRAPRAGWESRWSWRAATAARAAPRCGRGCKSFATRTRAGCSRV